MKNFYLLWVGVLFVPLMSAQGTILPAVDACEQFQQLGLLKSGQLPRLHLGCGQNHFSGYINIDFSPTEHTVQIRCGADVFGDITHMRFKQQSVQEIRSHHVFEHFDRSQALAFLVAWQLWLVQDGTLIIEVPDFATSIAMLADPQYTYEQKQVVMRHIFGSHEASWAIHCDGWYAEKFQHVLTAMGFDEIIITHSSWLLTHNVTVCAKKTKILPREELIAAAYSILRESMVDTSPSEEKMCQVWLQKTISELDCLLV